MNIGEGLDRILHIYGQYAWQDDVQICGTRDALVALRDTIDAALGENSVASTEPFFCTDGEGYGITVYRTKGLEMPIGSMPYAADYAQ